MLHEAKLLGFFKKEKEMQRTNFKVKNEKENVNYPIKPKCLRRVSAAHPASPTRY